MKNIKKLLFPVATIAASAGLVTPLLTSCGATTGISEISQGYIPDIKKHGSEVLADPDEMAADYLSAIKANPSILDEDNKYSSGQVYDLIVKLFDELKDRSNAEPEQPVPEITFSSFKAGATDLEVTEDGKYSYKNGISASLTAKVNVWVNLILYMLTGENEWLEPSGSYYKDYGYHDIVITTNNLGYETKFTNFDKFNVTHAALILAEQGDYTLVQPVFPTDLTDKTWAVDLAAHGDLNVTINDVEVVSLPNIDLSYHFDYKNIALLATPITDLVTRIIGQSYNPLASDLYLTDALQELGSFASYYLSDVTCANRLNSRTSLVDFYENDGTYSDINWYGEVKYVAGDIDGTLCHITHFDASTPATRLVDITKSTPATTYKAVLGLSDNNIYNSVDYAIVKNNKDNKWVSEWKERHTLTPRFNVNLGYNTITGNQWYSNEYKIYNYGTQCVFHVSASETTPITSGQKFHICDEQGTQKYTTLKDVSVWCDGVQLEEGTDYQLTNENQSIKFLKDHKETTAEEITIMLTCDSALETVEGTKHSAIALIE